MLGGGYTASGLEYRCLVVCLSNISAGVICALGKLLQVLKMN